MQCKGLPRIRGPGCHAVLHVSPNRSFRTPYMSVLLGDGLYDQIPFGIVFLYRDS